MFCMLKKKKIYPAYIWKHNSNRQKQVIILFIPNGERWHYFAVKRLSSLLRGTMSKYQGDFYCLSCLHSFATEIKRESHKKRCQNKDFCNVIMPSKDTKIVEFSRNQKYDKVPFVILADLECIV